jgi:hypothetical protein
MENVTSPLTPGLTFSVELVTPEVAADWMNMIKVKDDVRVQRNLNSRRVSRYGSDMMQGQWPFLGDPVRFSAPDPDGQVFFIDGQHRAEGIIESGVAIPLLVIRGFPFELMQHFDIGGRRTFVNYLQMYDVASPSDVASILTMLWHWRTGKFGYRGMPRVADPAELGQDPTHAELWALYKRTPTVTQAVIRAREVYRLTNKRNVKRSQLGLMYILFGEVDPYKRDAFFAELVRQEPPLDLRPGYPISTLRDRWGRQGATAFQQARSLERWAHMAFLIKTWNAWYDGERINTLVPGPSGWNQLPRIRGLVDQVFEVDEDAEAQFAAEFDGKEGADL